MGSWDGEMREDKRKGRNWEEGWKVSRKARQSEKCVFVQARAFEWVQDKVGDYGRSEETLWHPTRCPAPLSPPPPSLPCQHEHPVHTQGSCRNYGPLCFEDTLTECTNTWCIISKRSQSVQSVLFVGDCQQWLLNFSIYQGLPVLEHRFSGGSMAFKRTSSGVDMDWHWLWHRRTIVVGNSSSQQQKQSSLLCLIVRHIRIAIWRHGKS